VCRDLKVRGGGDLGLFPGTNLKAYFLVQVQKSH
jgi:hypothetical protein